MAKSTVASASTTLFSLLEPFTPEERARIVRGTLMLLGEPADTTVSESGAAGSDAALASMMQSKGARAFFDKKQPKTKIEELATAARYHEGTANNAPITSTELDKIIHGQARRNFDKKRFNRDIHNAQTAGFFNKGKKGNYTLSYYGQNFIDALPDRAMANAIKRPKRSGAKTSKGKAKAKKPVGTKARKAGGT